MSVIRIVLVDDHAVVRAGLRSYLESFDDLEVVGEAASGEALLADIEGWAPDLVVMDVLLPGGMDGIEATRRLARLALPTRVVVLTAFTDDARIVAALRAGAIAYVRKDAAPEALLDAVRGAARGRSNLDPAIAAALLADVAQPGAASEAELTERELEVLRRMAHGESNRGIAAALVIGEETVKSHVGSILGKLQAAHRTRAVVAALKQGLISLDDIDLDQEP